MVVSCLSTFFLHCSGSLWLFVYYYFFCFCYFCLVCLFGILSCLCCYFVVIVRLIICDKSSYDFYVLMLLHSLKIETF